MFVYPDRTGARHCRNAETGFMGSAAFSFCFELEKDDQRQLREINSVVVQSGCLLVKRSLSVNGSTNTGQRLDQQKGPRNGGFSAQPLAAFALAVISLGSAIYLLQPSSTFCISICRKRGPPLRQT